MDNEFDKIEQPLQGRRSTRDKDRKRGNLREYTETARGSARNNISNNHLRSESYYYIFINYLRLNDILSEHTYKNNQLDIIDLDGQQKQLESINKYNKNKNALMGDMEKRKTSLHDEGKENKITIDDLENDRQMNIRNSILSLGLYNRISRFRSYKLGTKYRL